MSKVRRLILRPILRDGLLTAEGEVWKRSRKAIAPVFTPRHAKGFAGQMLRRSEAFVERYAHAKVQPFTTNVASDMTELTFDILAETLFSGEVAVEREGFVQSVEELLHRMGRVDPMDILLAPEWMPRLTRIGGKKVMNRFRTIVSETMALRRRRMATDPTGTPNDFLTLLLQTEGASGLSTEEIEDNILTFIGAGHETTARRSPGHSIASPIRRLFARRWRRK